jgi:DNA invertase Pin-like site-specific DNA recombinase
MLYGYAGVSTDGQNIAAQVAQLTAAGCERLFKETVTGPKTERAQLARAVAAPEPGEER